MRHDLDIVLTLLESLRVALDEVVVVHMENGNSRMSKRSSSETLSAFLPEKVVMVLVWIHSLPALKLCSLPE
jgi:hypothetical protein